MEEYIEIIENEEEVVEIFENEEVIIPIGELIITENGIYDVTKYASVKVIVPNNTGDGDTSPVLDKAILGTMILQ